jgi:hypothetical protein
MRVQEENNDFLAQEPLENLGHFAQLQEVQLDMQVEHKDGTKADPRVTLKAAQDMHTAQDPKIAGKVG